MIVIQASEVAALCGLNPYKDEAQARQDMINRNMGLRSTDSIRTSEICSKDKSLSELKNKIRSSQGKTQNTGQVAVLTESINKEVSRIESDKISKISDKLEADSSKITSDGPITRSKQKKLDMLNKEAEEARKKVESESLHMVKVLKSDVNTSFGTRKETNVGKIYESMTYTTLHKDNKCNYWHLCPTAKVVGKFDGFNSNGTLVEIKNRMRRLFGKVPEYERTQVHVHMKMADVDKAHLVEGHDGKVMIHDVEMDSEFMDQIETKLLNIVSSI